MLVPDYLTQRLIRLEPADAWTSEGQGLCFLLPKGGAAKYASERVTHQMSPGDVLVFSAAAPGRVSAFNGGDVLFHQFSVCLEHLVALLAAREVSAFQEVAERFEVARLYPASGGLARECHRLLAEIPPQFTLDHRSQLLRIVAVILSEEFKNARSRREGFVRVEDHLSQVLEGLSSHEILQLSVEDLARKFGCSRRHLNRLFHVHFGTSVGALKMEMRLLKAAALLQNPDAKVISVAEECGFHHLGLFNTCFKKRFGASPGQWRKVTVRIEVQPVGGPEGTGSCQMRKNGLCPWTDRHSLARRVQSPTAPA